MDERQVAREVTDAEVACEIDGVCHRLSLYNLSSRGCMMDSPAGHLLQGRRLAVDFSGGERIPICVIWQNGQMMGVQFLSALPDEVIGSLAFRTNEFDSYFPSAQAHGAGTSNSEADHSSFHSRQARKARPA